jgi:hypothetical protein
VRLRVVDAYWISDDTLQQTETRQLYDRLRERFQKQLQGRTRVWVLGEVPVAEWVGREIEGRGFADNATYDNWSTLHWKSMQAVRPTSTLQVFTVTRGKM